MSNKASCQVCLFLRILLIGSIGALVGIYLSFLPADLNPHGTTLIWPAVAGALAALLLARRWLK